MPFTDEQIFFECFRYDMLFGGVAVPSASCSMEDTLDTSKADVSVGASTPSPKPSNRENGLL